MSLYQLISDAVVESWILCAGWESRWVGVSVWFSVVVCIPSGHSLDIQSKTVKTPSVLNRMTYLLLNPMKQTHFKIPPCAQVPPLRTCLHHDPEMLPRGFPFLRMLLSSLLTPCFGFWESCVFAINPVFLGGAWVDRSVPNLYQRANKNLYKSVIYQ